ncbi:MAG TPA: ABC transporter permease [Cyclobacteriaceae bacterium]|nr:ABC transporter permease [Cyclobacteriaceae bacterium]
MQKRLIKLMGRSFFNIYIAIEAVLANRVRSILTALGIIFGVGAVIAMLAIGNGAQQEILEQIKLVGVNNIVIEPVIEQTEEKIDETATGEKEKKKFSPGLTIKDMNAIMNVIPTIVKTSPEIILDTHIIKSGIRRSTKLVGVEPHYFELTNFELEEGKMFSKEQLITGAPVCIIGKHIGSRFFPTENPIGKQIKCGNQWLEVIGVLKERYISDASISNLGIRNYNMDVYAPIQTVLIRYKNRELITQGMLSTGTRFSRGRVFITTAEEEDEKSLNYHQVDRLVVQVSQTEELTITADIISRMLQRRHYDMVDYSISIPELLLKQQQKTKKIFNMVLGVIAGISLLVGGIGIMNIMLASVLERIKEIGLRLSIGAQKRDIIQQFLFEAIMISITGGIIGILLGVGLAVIVSKIADIPTIVTPFSILISFGVAATVGLIFGITPAKRAANQDPITSLRYE